MPSAARNNPRRRCGLTKLPCTAIGAALATVVLHGAELRAQSQWREVELLASRDGVAMAADELRGRLVAFGGDDGARRLGDTWMLAGNQWQRRTPPTSPPPRREARLVFDPVRQELVLFGGLGITGAHNDTWRYDGTDWSVANTGAAPPARHGHGMAFDRASGAIVLFGGTGQQAVLGDTWSWNGTAWQLQSASGAPGARTDAAMAADGNGAPLLFGGRAAHVLGGTFSWQNGSWQALAAATPPPARYGATLLADRAAGNTLLVGGADAVGVRGDTWLWDGIAWRHLPNALGMSPRADAAGALDPHTLLPTVAFGRDSSGQRCGDTRTFDGVQWQLHVSADAPTPRSGASLCDDPARGRSVLFGGVTSNGTDLPDTWEWHGTGWQQFSAGATAGPTPRHLHSAGYDDGRGTVLLFGGLAGNQTMADCWEWNGTAWSQLFPAMYPPGRHSAAMCRAPGGGLLLFGGVDPAYANLDDTWRWHSSGWSRTFGAAPPARFGHGLAYDAARSQAVLFGGRNHQQYFGDTWLFDGAGWTQVQPAHAPPACAHHSLAGADERQRVLLCGGLDGNLQALVHSWEWDGQDWSPSNTTSSPSGRVDAMLSHHSGSERTMLFGGSDLSRDRAETIAFAAVQPATTAIVGSPCAQPSGSVHMTASNFSRPWLGDVYELQLDGLPMAPGLAMLLFGYSNQFWNGVPLPRQLAGYGLPGCMLWIAADAAVFVTHQGGTLRHAFAVPNAPLLRGFTYWNQALALDPSYANPRQGTTTNALRATLGAR